MLLHEIHVYELEIETNFLGLSPKVFQALLSLLLN